MYDKWACLEFDRKHIHKLHVHRKQNVIYNHKFFGSGRNDIINVNMTAYKMQRPTVQLAIINSIKLARK